MSIETGHEASLLRVGTLASVVIAKPGALVSAIIAATTIYCVIAWAYNLYFHPLAAFPGPFWARSSLLWRIWVTSGGRSHRAITKAHKKYGDVIRVSPNELSFASVSSWKEIYGHPTASRPAIPKATFYDIYGASFKSGCIGSERNPRTHGRMRKSLSAAFSTKALLEQEPIVQGVVDAFCDKLGTIGAKPEGLNMTKWFEMVAFDLLGEMAFGEGFGAIESETPHFWSDLIVDHLFGITIIDNLRRIPTIATLGKLVLPTLTSGVKEKHTGFSREKVARRMARKDPRKDFMENYIEKVRSGEISEEEMTAHASTLIIAGGETIATFFAATTYYLLTTPRAYKKLCTEIRSRWNDVSEIDALSSQQLVYLQAVISEGLRIYAPGSQGFPRESPGTVIDGYFVPKGADVYTSAWTVTHDERYFHDPFTFKPERWIDSDCKDVKEASQAFSLGPRGCLGRK